MKLNSTTALVIVAALAASNLAHAQPEGGFNATAAKILDILLDNTHSNYQQSVAQKLQADGTGDTSNHGTQSGFVMPADEFMRKVTTDALIKTNRIKRKQFAFFFAPGNTGRISVRVLGQNLDKQEQAVLIAQMLDGVFRSIRGIYSKSVVGKLKADGYGSAIDYQTKRGFVPLPAVFARAIASETEQAVQSSDSKRFSVGLRSRWNLNQEQGISAGFERDGWEHLARQEITAKSNGKSLQAHVWAPYYRFENTGGRKVLRFFSADIAAADSCVSCHNSWENRDNIIAMRSRQGVPSGKQFELHGLMGALSIEVDL